MRKSIGWAFVLVLGIFWALTPGVAAESGALDPAAKRVGDFYAVLLDSMRRGNELGVQGRYKVLEPAVDAAFDVPEMTRLTVGPAWASLSEPDRQKVIAAFRRMTIANYAANFDDYGGQQFSVDPNVVERNGEKIVRSQLSTPDGKAPIPFVYRMHASGDGWKAVDVYLNGVISQLAARRADFSSTLQTGGASLLAEKVNGLADNLVKSK
jgi:phospholipid transport system substrate-binding protein